MTAASEHPARSLTVAVDVGGTFTDVTLVDRVSGQRWKTKTATTPPDFETGFITGIRDALRIAGRSPAEVAQVAHGTTVATNAILEMRGAPSALVTTKGFRHVLEIGRHDIPRKASIYSYIKPKRPVSAANVHEVGGRIAADGTEVDPLDDAALEAAALAIRARGITAVAVCFLNSFTNPDHERRAREIILAAHPEAMVSISAEVLPVFREFERSMATILNVYVMPLVASYVARLNEVLDATGISAPLLLMKSSGGVTGAATIRREPIQTALSGPAAGIVGAVHEAGFAGHSDVITVDIGGTSADICLIKDGRPGMTTKGQVGDWPMTLPMVDIHTIGAGGGSIARVTASGSLTVGPESAGALPGPVSYGRGGTEPTVTDAHLVLGHLPQKLLAGQMDIDLDAARQAIETRIARPLGLSVPEAAQGILQVVNNNMLGAIRVVSVERGLDPRDFALLPFGGAGPIHGSDLARLIGIRTVLVPPSPGVLSAIGLTVSSLRNEFALTSLQLAGQVDHVAVGAQFAALEADAARWLADEGVPDTGRTITREVAARYRHQGFELTVPWPAGVTGPAAMEAVIQAFHAEHQRLYSFVQEDVPIEIVTLQVTATGDLPMPARRPLEGGVTAAEARIGEQEVYVGGAMVPAPIYDRALLAAGEAVKGPAILQQLDTTTFLDAGDVARVHEHGSLLVEIG